MDIYVEQQHLQTWGSETDLFLWLIYSKQTLHIIKHSNDWQVYSVQLLKRELQIPQFRLCIGHKNEKHFEVVLLTFRPNNNDMNKKSDTFESLMKN